MRTTRRTLSLAAGITAASAGIAFAAHISTGPSTTVSPYVVPVAPGVATKALLTVGDKPTTNGYRMVGIPDGLGLAAGATPGTFRVVMNHELRNTAGVPRRHGYRGAFVSDFQISKATGEVTSGRDLINPDLRYWDYPSRTYRNVASSGGPNPRKPGDTFVAQTNELNRFCSNTLSAPGQFLNGKKGYDGQIFFPNEEAGDESRVFGTTLTGETQQLPRLGMFSWENANPAATTSDTTLVAGSEDGGSGQFWLYAGQKQSTGNPFDRAGLTNGRNFVIDMVDQTVTTDGEYRAKYGKNTRAPFVLNEVDWDQSGRQQNIDAAAKGLSLIRIEDASWDPRNKNVLYFATTEGGDKTPRAEGGASRDGGGIWRLEMKDVDKPEKGGVLELLLDGSEAPFLNKPDNIGIDDEGNLLIQEDPGSNDHVARIVAFDVDSGARGVVAEFDRARFTPGAPGFLTRDEESSGIIDAQSALGEGTWIFDAQVHKANPDPELVEEGQLLTLTIEDYEDVYTIDAEDYREDDRGNSETRREDGRS